MVYDKKNRNSQIIQQPTVCKGEVVIGPIGKMNDEFIFELQGNSLMTEKLNKDSDLRLAEGHNPVLVFAKCR